MRRGVRIGEGYAAIERWTWPLGALSVVTVSLVSWALLAAFSTFHQSRMPWGSTRVLPSHDSLMLLASAIGLAGGLALWKRSLRAVFGEKYDDYVLYCRRRAQEVGPPDRLGEAQRFGRCAFSALAVILGGFVVMAFGRFAVATPEALLVRAWPWSATDRHSYAQIVRIEVETAGGGKHARRYTIEFGDGSEWVTPYGFDDKQQAAALVRYLSTRTGISISGSPGPE